MEFIHDSRSVGIVLICVTTISLIVSNTQWGDVYVAFWQRELTMPMPEIHLPHSILHIINDALMALFFLLVGLEIKRELLVGELNSLKKSLLPVIGAAGGMVVPALIYTIWCGNTDYSSGWGIPMATDIAFSLGILSLLGNRVSISVKIFLMALAIIDDLGGILTIALFYAGNLQWNYLLYAGIIMAVLTSMNLLKVKRYYLYFALGMLLWYCVYNSGVHATIAGVLLAFTIPLHKIEELEHSLHDPVNFIILPLFALANTAIILPADFSSIYSSVVHHGITMGLVVGKPLGIYLFSMTAVRLKIANLPTGMKRPQLLGMGLIAGIGFTMSIFMATLAFDDEETQLIAKVAIIGASSLAGIAGYIFLSMQKTKTV
ncbi:Na+/H+ antiporter NhaA [Chitinophagaceae bacterium IBVUCB1]|nr:Na+/H+ antiporter NhaA [Chitinophagaceae bacterium IBVUCB1]